MIPIVITQRGSKRIETVTESLKKAGIEKTLLLPSTYIIDIGAEKP